MRSILRLKSMLIGGCLLLCLACLGCLLISKTFTIVFYIEEEIESTDKTVSKPVYVNLEGNDIWEDHKDEIKSIESVEFYVEVTNEDPNTVATGRVYVSDESLLTLEAIREKATLVLDGIEIQPLDTKVIEREESVQYIQNFEVLRDQVMSGTFYVYGVAKETPFHVVFSDSLAVIISFTAGP